MNENYFNKKNTAPNEPTERQSDFIDTTLDGTDFKISDYSTDRVVNNTAKPENGFVASQIEVADSIIDGTTEHNATLIKRAGQPTVPGIEVVEPISKLSINPDVLKSTPTIDKNPNAEPVRLDQRLAPSAREEERARAREAAKKPWWKKMIGG